eukprot:3934325-Rhodomonas_salina.4
MGLMFVLLRNKGLRLETQCLQLAPSMPCALEFPVSRIIRVSSVWSGQIHVLAKVRSSTSTSLDVSSQNAVCGCLCLL